MYRLELMVCPSSIKSRRIIPFLSQKTVDITLPAEDCVSNIFFSEKFTFPLHNRLMFWLWLILVTPHLVTSNYMIQKNITFKLLLVQLVLTNLHTVFFLFLCEYLSQSHWSKLWYSNITKTDSNTLKTIFSSVHNTLVVICWFVHFLLMETLPISWCDSCVWPSRTWLVFHIAFAIAEAHHSLTQCAHIYCLISIHVQQESMNLSGCNVVPNV